MIVTDICDRILSIAELDPGVQKDTSGTAPDTFEPNTAYCYPEQSPQELRQDETGPARRQAFRLLLLYMAPAWLEEASLTRDADVTTVLSSRRDDYLSRLAVVESCDLWAHIEATSDVDAESNFEGRACAVAINGYRYLN